MAKHSFQFNDADGAKPGSDSPDASGVSEAAPASEAVQNGHDDADEAAERVSEAKAQSAWHSHDYVQKMAAKASSGKHSPKSEEEEDPEDSPFSQKGKHAGGKDSFTADSAKYSRHAKAARRRKASIAASATIALVGTLVGVGLLVYSHQVGEDITVTGEPAEGTAANGAISSAEEEMAFSLSTTDSALTDEFLESEARAERQKPIESGAPEGSPEAGLDQFGSFEVTADGLLSLPGQEEPFAFALDEEDATMPQLSSEHAEALDAALEAASEGDAQVGCILVDLQTGRGIAANLDAQPYGASAFKGPFCAFLCDRADHGGADVNGIQESIEAIVVYSDNDAYDALRASMGDEDLANWLAECGVPEDEQLHRDWYPFQSARESSIMWLHINDYLNSDAEHAEWLSGLFGDTQVSFIRDGIDDKDVIVRNKGGWYVATWEDMDTWNGTCDAGIVECNGHTYLMSVMTGQPVTDEAMENVSAIAKALWDARADLAEM